MKELKELKMGDWFIHNKNKAKSSKRFCVFGEVFKAENGNEYRNAKNIHGYILRKKSNTEVRILHNPEFYMLKRKKN